MISEQINKVLVLAPHTDDGEFGCGATISKLIEAGKEVHLAAFSPCRKSVPEGFPKDVLEHELKAATAVLGIKPEHLYLYEYEVRIFPSKRQEILEDMIRLRKKVAPDLVFIPSLNDVHQDHFTIAEEGRRAFKFSNILSYEMPWNNFNFNTACFIKVSDKDLDQKIAALKEYKSQYFRTYADEHFIKSLASVRGTQSGGGYAETFEIVRWIIK